MQPVVFEQRPEVVYQLGLCHRIEAIRLVERHHHDRGVTGKRTQVTLVQRSVGVLLWIHHPHEEVDQPHETVDLEAMGELDRVVIGKVQQHHAVEPRVGLPEAVATGNAEPVEEVVGRVLAPDARLRNRGRGPPHADVGKLEARERIEERRLAASGRARESHDRQLRSKAEPPAGPFVDFCGLGHEPFLEPALGHHHCFAQGSQALVQPERPPTGTEWCHERVASTAAAAALMAPAWSCPGTRESTTA